MTLLDLKGGNRFLSEAIPHEFQNEGMDVVETTLWAMYYNRKSKESK
jgi:hypothetical protein